MLLFAAIEIPEYVRDELAVWWSEASLYLPVNEWRDVAQRNWHMTLAFYGEVSGSDKNGSDVNTLAEALDDCATATPPLDLIMGSESADCGVFPRSVRPRVFWAGVASENQTKDLKNLARCCRRAGHATLRKRTAKERPFRGHITLARAGDFATQLTAECWQTLPTMPQLTWTATSLTLFASHLRPEGAQYQRVEEFIFEGK